MSRLATTLERRLINQKILDLLPLLQRLNHPLGLASDGGQTHKCARADGLRESALPRKPTSHCIAAKCRDVPTADSCSAANDVGGLRLFFDHLVAADECDGGISRPSIPGGL